MTKPNEDPNNFNLVIQIQTKNTRKWRGNVHLAQVPSLKINNF
jgi:hypothetical protein